MVLPPPPPLQRSDSDGHSWRPWRGADLVEGQRPGVAEQSWRVHANRSQYWEHVHGLALRLSSVAFSSVSSVLGSLFFLVHCMCNRKWRSSVKVIVEHHRGTRQIISTTRRATRLNSSFSEQKKKRKKKEKRICSDECDEQMTWCLSDIVFDRTILSIDRFGGLWMKHSQDYVLKKKKKKKRAQTNLESWTRGHWFRLVDT